MERESIPTLLFRHLFGRKYYAVIVNMAGTFDYSICGSIFRSKEEAKKHKRRIDETRAYEFAEIVSFRSRNEEYNDSIRHE